MDRRDQYICAALTGLLAGRDAATLKAFADDAVAIADAALAAAGEQEPAFRDLYSVTINGVEYSTTNRALVAEIARLKEDGDHEGCCSISFHNSIMRDKNAELARLKRQAEPLTDIEVHEAWNEVNGLALNTVREWDRAIAAVKSRRV